MNVGDDELQELRHRFNNLETYMMNQEEKMDSMLQLLTHISATNARAAAMSSGDHVRPAFDPYVPGAASLSRTLSHSSAAYDYRGAPSIEIQDITRQQSSL